MAYTLSTKLDWRLHEAIKKGLKEASDYQEFCQWLLDLGLWGCDYADELCKYYGVKNLFQICGPVSSGGLGTPEKNLEHLQAVAAKCEQAGLPIFNQAVFEPILGLAHQRWPAIKATTYTNRDYVEEILILVYNIIFASGLIGGLALLPNAETSRGARWEFRMGKHFDLRIIPLPNKILELSKQELLDHF